jgi:hypothetical protein
MTGTSQTDIYLVGDYCRVWGFDGATWRIDNPCYGNPDSYFGLWSIGSDVFATGMYGLGVHGSR